MSQVSIKSHESQKNKALQIVTDNISAMANMNHMGGQSHLLTLITKVIDTASINYQHFAVRGRYLLFLFTNHGDPSS